MIIKVVPDLNLSNSDLNHMLSNLCRPKTIAQQVSIKNRRIAKQDKIIFEILLTRKSTEFFYICEDNFSDLVLNELRVMYPRSELKYKSYVEKDGKGVLSVGYPEHMIDVKDVLELGFSRNSFLSLKTDMRKQQPLTALLESRGILNEDEKILIQYILTPCEDSISGEFGSYISDFKKNKILKGKSIVELKQLKEGVAKGGYELVADFIDIFSLLFTGEEFEKEDLDLLNSNSILEKGLSSNTIDKASSKCYNTSIRIGVETPKGDERGKFLLGAFKSPFLNLRGDNEFKELKPFCKKQKLLKLFKQRKSWDYISENIYSVKELQQLMQLPTKVNQKEFSLECIDSREFDVPVEFTRTGLWLGRVKFKDRIVPLRLPLDDLDSLCQCFVTIGKMGSGKTTFAQNVAIQLLENDVAVFAIDVADGSMIDNIANGLDPKFKKSVILDFGDVDNPIPISWNEKSGEWSKTYARVLSDQLKNFLNKLADSDMEKLRPRMKKYLGAVSKAVFVREDANLSDVIMCLTNADFRHRIIKENNIHGRMKTILLDLDDPKESNGTKRSYVAGILDRIDSLLDNEFVANCLLQSSSKEINFRKWADEGYFVGIKIPKSTLLDDATDLLVTYIVSKLWLAILSREDTSKDDRKPCMLILDEPHQFPTVLNELISIIREMRKWRFGIFIMAHEFGDFRSMKGVLKSSGANYIIYQTSKETYRELLEEFEPFELSELMETKWRHAKIVLRYGDKTIKVDCDMTGRTPIKRLYKQKNVFGRPVDIVEQEILDKMAM